MRTFKFIGVALIAIMMGANFASCSSDDEVLSTPTEPEAGIESPKEYIVSLGWKGEILNIYDSPLTYAANAENTDLYGIQVYSSPDIENNSENYTEYAYGLFDNVDKITIKLLAGYKYKFVATMVVDGKNSVRSTSGNGFYSPFENSEPMGYPNYTPITNSFRYSNIVRFRSLDGGYTYTNKYGNFYRAPVERYYGELSDYTPSENGTANISMKRTSFGVKVVAKEMTEGKLTVKIDKSIEVDINFPDTEFQEIITFKDVKQAWKGNITDMWGNVLSDEFYEEIPISFSWTKNNGVEIPLKTEAIEFKRNKLTTIEIKVIDEGSDNNIGITYDETGDMVDGGTVKIEPNESSDNDVNPQT